MRNPKSTGRNREHHFIRLGPRNTNPVRGPCHDLPKSERNELQGCSAMTMRDHLFGSVLKDWTQIAFAAIPVIALQ